MNRRRTGWQFILAAILILGLAVEVGGWFAVALSALSALCTFVALRLFTVGGGRR